MSLERLFPEAVEAGKVEHAEDWVAIEENGQTYYLPLANLSEREKALLALQNDGILEDKVTENPWYRYLIQDDLSVAKDYKALQIIYIDHKESLPEELCDFFVTLLPNLLATVVISKTRTLLILDQEEMIEAKDLIDDVLPTLESDFGIKLTIFFGNVWCKFQADDLPAIKHKMLQAIDDSKDIRPIIMTMWQEQDNLAKTAQSLYIHRNSLHYKIEKFRLLSGLNLKNLSDLAFSYLLIMEN